MSDNEEEFDAVEFWKFFEEQRQDREFFAQKIKEQQEEKTNIVQFPINIKFELDIQAIEEKVAAISIALDDVMYELRELKRRLSKKQ